MKLFVTGAAGHTGLEFVRLYLAASGNNQLMCPVRPSTDIAELSNLDKQRVEVVTAELTHTDLVAHHMRGCDAVMHVAHQTLCPSIAEAAFKARVDRVYFVTTTGVFSRFNDLSQGYREIEQVVRDSELIWTILRPTMIYGSERDANMNKLLRLLDKTPVFPVFGSGQGLMQPVHAIDLAKGLMQAMLNGEKTERKEYNLPGLAPLTYNEIIKKCIAALGKPVTLVHVPKLASLCAAKGSELVFGEASPLKSEQVRRLDEDKAYSWSAAYKDFEYAPRPFSHGIVSEVRRLRDLGLLSCGEIA